MTALVSADGVPRIAAFDHPLDDPNLEDARIDHALARLADVQGLEHIESVYRRRFRLKSWQYMTAVSDELFLGFIIGTAGYASNAFVYASELPVEPVSSGRVAELSNGRLHKRIAITPLSLGTSIAPTSTTGGHRFRAPKLSLGIESRGGRGFGVRIDAKVADPDGVSSQLTARLDFGSAPQDQHLATCVPLPGGRWSYTHKFMAFAVSGDVELGGRTFQFRPGAWGTMDFTKQYALRHSVWRWVALCGKSRQGAVIGVNLVDPTPDAPISENAVWIDGKLEPASEVHLSETTAEADSVDLQLEPVARFEQKLDVPLVRHHLRHAVSAFSGHVRTRSGHIHDLDRVIGIAEHNDTWW